MSDESATQQLDMSPGAILGRRVDMATQEATSPLTATANALASLQRDQGFVDTMALESVLLQRLTMMKDGKDTAPLADLLYGEALALDGLFKNLLQQASLQEIHPERRRGLLDLSLKAQRQARTTIETLASLIAPEPKTLIQTNMAHQQIVSNGDGRNETDKRELNMDNFDG
ncbi:MAG: hypothetical protein KA155_07065 [Alphaproteobacteria bacterium]|jgi:hypothetical protein|nr:hypothetical protein [Alphaproteobacteria bacterium]